jgi:fatty-acyl-CoA synthase
MKDMIIYAGDNVSPAEVESVLCGHPALAEAAVIGTPDDRWGEQVKTIVVRVPGVLAEALEIRATARERCIH